MNEEINRCFIREAQGEYLGKGECKEGVDFELRYFVGLIFPCISEDRKYHYYVNKETFEMLVPFIGTEIILGIKDNGNNTNDIQIHTKY